MSKKTYEKLAQYWKTSGQPKLEELAGKANSSVKKGWKASREQAQTFASVAVPLGVTGLEEARKRFAELSATLSQGELLKWLETVTQGTATVYDKALDAEYLKNAIGGGNHRLFDGGHDLLSAWERAQDALPDDTFSQEVLGYLSALWKDGSTLKGLPFQTLEKADYEGWTNAICDLIPGIPKGYLYDLCSFDALEVCTSGIGVVGVIFALKDDDKKRLSEILGAMGITSIASANPLMGLVAIASTAYAVFVKKRELDQTAFFKSGAVAALSALVFAIVGLPFLIELVLVVVLTKLFRKHVLDDEALLSDLKRHLAATASTSATQVQIMAKKIVESIEQFELKRTGTKP